MSHPLYHEELKALAASAHGAGSLASVAERLRVDNPFCGDRVDLVVKCRDGRIDALIHETKACLLCRASASLLGLRGPGLPLADARVLHDEVSRLLTASAERDLLRWPELAYFLPVAAHPSRHGCVLLPFEALRQWLAKGNGSSPGLLP